MTSDWSGTYSTDRNVLHSLVTVGWGCELEARALADPLLSLSGDVPEVKSVWLVGNNGTSIPVLLPVYIGCSKRYIRALNLTVIVPMIINRHSIKEIKAYTSM